MFADFMNMELKRMEIKRTEETTYFGKRIKRSFLKEEMIDLDDLSIDDKDVIVYEALSRVVD